MTTDNVQEIKNLVQSHYPLIFATTSEEGRLESILDTVAQQLAIPFLHWTCTRGIERWGTDNPVHETEDALKALEYVGKSPYDAIFLFKDLHPFLDKPHVVRKLRDISRSFAQGKRSLVISGPDLVVPKELEKAAVRYEIKLPTEEELKDLVRMVYVQSQRVGKVTLSLSTEEFNGIIQALRGMTKEEAERALSDAILRDMRLDAADRELILARKKEAVERTGILELYCHAESFADVGGLDNLKTWLTRRRGAFTEEARRFGLPAPKGLLLLGVPGCGKSLCAKAVAREWSLPLLRFDPSRLYNQYVGETEKSLSQAIRMAEYISPAILWIDEIEKGFSHSSSSEADAGLSRRVFGTFIAWLQEKTAPVFIVATCNSIAELPPELLRKGRFDEIFFVDLPGPADRQDILAIHLRKRGRDPAQFDLPALVAATDQFSGAEVEQAIVSGLYAAFSGTRQLTTELVLAEIAATKPLAVTLAEQIDELRLWAQPRTVPASKVVDGG